MADKEPNPRNVRRLQSLEADLQAMRESSQAVIAERDDLQKRLTATERDLKKAQTTQEQLQAEVTGAVEAFEELVAGGYLKRPRKRALSGYVEAVAKQLVSVSDALQAAQERVAELEKARAALEEQMAAGEQGLRDALAKIQDLQQQIETRVTASEQRAQELEAALAEAQKTIGMLQTDDQTISQLVEQNRQLAAQIDTLTGDIAVVRETAKEAQAGLEAARAETEASVRAELADQIKKLETQRDSLQSQLTTATKQLETEGKTPLLPADKVAEMINGLVEQMQTGIGGLRIRDGEIRLKVGFGAVGETGGFVVPTTDSPPEIRENLQDVTFRFDRSSVETSQLRGE